MNISHPAKGGKKKIPTRRRYASSSPLSNKTSYENLFYHPCCSFSYFSFQSLYSLEFRFRTLEEYLNFVNISFIVSSDKSVSLWNI